MKDESPFEAVKRVLAGQFGIKDPTNIQMMMLIDAVRETSPPHREATFDTLRAILRSLSPVDGLEAWASRCADEITSWMAKDAEIRKVALAVGEGFWCSIEGTLSGMLMRATRGLDIAPSTPSVTRDLDVWEKLHILVSILRQDNMVHDVILREDGTLSLRLRDYKDPIEVTAK